MKDSLPRKVGDFDGMLHRARVHEDCVAIWRAGRRAGRQDTFIGLIHTQTWIFYIAPCFGVEAGAVQRNANEIKADYMMRIATGAFKPKTAVIGSSSTATAEEDISKDTAKSLEKVYGHGNICYVELDPNRGFDGYSHQALSRWVNHRYDLNPKWWKAALGFGIQRDNAGYFVRFASTLNQRFGQLSGDRFEPRTSDRDYSNREPRDLPKQWAQLTEQVLARDLGLALLNPEARFERMAARGDEGKTTKFRRFQIDEPAHRQQPHSSAGCCTLL